MNVLQDRQQVGAALRLGPLRHVLAPTGTAYVAVDGTLWHEFVSMDVDSENYWVTTRPDPHKRHNREEYKNFTMVKDPDERDTYFA
jgi:hypothetical protein